MNAYLTNGVWFVDLVFESMGLIIGGRVQLIHSLLGNKTERSIKEDASHQSSSVPRSLEREMKMCPWVKANAFPHYQHTSSRKETVRWRDSELLVILGLSFPICGIWRLD